MIDLLINVAVVMLLCGFLYWVYLQLIPLAPIAGPFRQVLDVVVIIIVWAIVLFYAIIPLLRMIPHVLRW